MPRARVPDRTFEPAGTITVTLPAALLGRLFATAVEYRLPSAEVIRSAVEAWLSDPDNRPATRLEDLEENPRRLAPVS